MRNENSPLRLMCVLAHPDDETLGVGGTLAKCAAEGVETYVVTATRGQRGRYRDGSDHPGPEALGKIREAELRAAAAELGVREVSLLDYMDGDLARADSREAIERIVDHLRRVRPQVVVTFGPEGGYGHPDHIAICQLATAAVVQAASGAGRGAVARGHGVAKLYYMAWSQASMTAYQAAFKRLVSNVDGHEREATPWPDWAITTVLDTAAHWPAVWRAVRRHESQVAVFRRLAELSDEEHRRLWGTQEFYRVFSLVNGGRSRETDLFEGLR